MRKIYYLCLCFILLGSFKSEKSLEGVWMLAYKIEYPKKDISPIHIRSLYDFSEDKLWIKSFNHASLPDYGEIEEFNYKLKGNKLCIDTMCFTLKTITKDSLVIQLTHQYKVDLVLKRLIQVDKQPIPSFRNKAFSFTGPQYADSIDFINDSLFLDIGNNAYSNNRTKRWRTETYKSFNFLVLDMMFPTPFLINNSSEDEINLTAYFTTNKKFKLLEIKNKRDIRNLEGVWIGNRVKQGDFPEPPRPLKPRDFSGDIESDYALKINSDSLEYRQYYRTSRRKWLLNTTNDFIYFPDRLDSRNGIWKIKELNKDELRVRTAIIYNTEKIISYKRK